MQDMNSVSRKDDGCLTAASCVIDYPLYPSLFFFPKSQSLTLPV